MSGMLMGRMLSALIPEEKLVNDAIKELTEYRDAKFSTSNEPSEASFEGLKDFFENNPHQEINSDVKEPFACITALIIKWNDKGKSMEDIMIESAQFEEEIKKTNLVETKE